MLELLLSNWKIILIAALVAWAGLATKLWREEARAFTKYKVTIQAQADAQKAQYDKTVEDVSNAWNNQLPSVRSGAVAAYCRTHACGVPRPGESVCQAGGTQGADGAGQERVPDEKLIADCAEDALKIGAWQQWATENQLEVK